MTTYRNAYHKELCDLLVSEGKLRESRSDWILAERQAMHQRVNDIRASRGLPPIDIAEVERVEWSAVGHSDYSRKFSLYCAELVGV